MLLGVCECGDVPLVYGCEVDEEHVHVTRPSIRLPGSTFGCGCLVFLVVGVGVLFVVPSIIDGGCCVSCLWPGVAGG